MLSPFERFVWPHSQEKLYYKRYKPTALFFTIIWSWFEKWSCGRRGTRAWNLASPPQTASPYNQTVSRLPALIDGETVCCWDESNPIRVTCPSQTGMFVGATLLPNPRVSDFSPWRALHFCNPFSWKLCLWANPVVTLPDSEARGVMLSAEARGSHVREIPSA